MAVERTLDRLVLLGVSEAMKIEILISMVVKTCSLIQTMVPFTKKILIFLMRMISGWMMVEMLTMQDKAAMVASKMEALIRIDNFTELDFDNKH